MGRINFLILILGLVDVLVSLTLILKIKILYFLGILAIVKGLWTLVTSITYRSFFFFFIGVLDMVCGSMLFFGFFSPFLKLLPYMLLLKGVYSIIFST